jgi:hypothetical protein
MKRSSNLAIVCFLVASSFVCASCITPPDPPSSGPGGSNYLYSSCTKIPYPSTKFGNSYIYQPDGNNLPSSLPVIAFIHGYEADNGVSANEALVIHIVKKGYIVIYCDYEILGILPSHFEGNAAKNIIDGINYIKADSDCIQPATNPDGTIKFGLIGWSVGGVTALNIAANYAADDVPKPQFVVAMEANNGGEPFGIEITQMRDAHDIPCDTNILMVMAEEDDLAGTWDTSSKYWSQMTQIPESRRQWIGLYSDYNGTPDSNDLEAVHRWVAGGGIRDKINSLDYYGSYKWCVAIANDTFYGTDRSYWYGNTFEQTFMGNWSDGSAVNPAKASSNCAFWPNRSNDPGFPEVCLD